MEKPLPESTPPAEGTPTDSSAIPPTPVAEPAASPAAAAPVAPAGPLPGFMGVTLDELTSLFKEWSQPAYRAKQVMDWVYRKRVEDFASMSNIPAEVRDRLQQTFAFQSLHSIRITGSEDTTRKILWRLPDDALIESVLIPASPALYGESSDRLTLCVSTQVGCAYGCKFCASGLDGWARNLKPAEIVEQVYRAEAISGERVDNVVFMGMGEPLANLRNVMHAIAILNGQWGINIGSRHLTLSTSGLAPQIKDLADQPLQVRLAISLHGATDEVRQQIMPVNRKYPIAVLMEAIEYYTARKKQFVLFEYILIKDVNDSVEDAAALVRLARRVSAKVNCIPYNKVEGLPWERPSLTKQDAFMAVLREAKIRSTIRREKGHDIAAACGQLRRQTMKSGQ